MSLQWRIMGALLSVILLTVLLSIGVAYWGAQRQLDQLSDELFQQDIQEITELASKHYTNTQSWAKIEQSLIERGYIFNEDMLAINESLFFSDSEFALDGLTELQFVEIGGMLDDGDNAFINTSIIGASAFSTGPFHILIVDMDHNTVFDSHKELHFGEPTEGINAERNTIFDLRSQEAVGYVYAEVEPFFFASESDGFLSGILSTTFLGGLLTAAIILLPAIWLTRKIMAPISTLTTAMHSIAQNQNVQLLSVSSDDELGRMSEAFNLMTRTLAVQKELRKRLVDDVSHEFGTPLSIIHLEASALRDGLQSPQEASNQIVSEINSLRFLVQDLDRLAEADASDFHLELELLRIDQVINAAITRWEPHAQLASVELSLKPLPKLPAIEIDASRINQVLGNVIRNGLQHTLAGGKIEISAELRSIPMAPGYWIVVSISDDGSGIAPKDLPNIFERFYVADLSRTRNSEEQRKHGLGLAIARKFVLLHGGHIWVESDLGIGSCFFVALVPAQSKELKAGGSENNAFT